jgi:predicted N-acyltransferase
MSFEIRLAHSVQEIGEEVWARLAPSRPFTSYGWYRFGERVLADNVPLYVLLLDGGEPLACGAFWLRSNEPLPISSPWIRKIAGAILRRWPLLICQAPLADASGLLLPEPPRRDGALAAIARAAREEAARMHASFVAHVYLGPREAHLPAWPRPFVAADVPEPGTCLEITWPDFESYVAQLSRSARKDYRRHRNRAADLGVEVTGHRSVTDVEEALALFRKVEEKHGTMPDPSARAALENAGMVDATWLAARIDGRLVASGLLLRDGDAGLLKFLGLDYEVKYAYFSLVYAALREAIESGCRTLVGGAGAYEMKQRLGFEPVDTNYIVFAGRGPILGSLGHRLASSEERAARESDRGS